MNEDPGLSHKSILGIQSNDNPENVGFPNSGPGKETMRDQNEIEIPFSENGIIKKSSDEIEILHTDTLIKEVCYQRIIILNQVVACQ